MSSNSKNKWFMMSQKSDKEAEIYLYDDIGWGGVTAKDFVSELNQLGDVDTIHVRIDSGGGSIVAGNNILAALRRHPAKIITHNDSMAASMAGVIFIDGDERHMAENSLLMLHDPWTISIGTSEKLRKDANLLDKMEKNIRKAFLRSNKSDEEIDAIMKEETYFDANEAFEAGFVDVIDGANLAAASVADFKTVKENNYKIPQAKIDKVTIEALKKSNLAFKAQILDFDAKIEAVKIEAAEEKEAALAELKKEHESAISNITAEHDQALKNAKEVTQADISTKAAQLLAKSGTPAVITDMENIQIEGSITMTANQFWEKYNSLKEERRFEEAQEFYTENKHILK